MEKGTQLNGLRLSDEAINLFFSQGGFARTEPVDLRGLFEGTHSEAIRSAAKAWGRDPAEILV